MTKGLIVRADNTKDYVEIQDWKEIQDIVGGFFSVVDFGNKGYFCYIDDEGKLKNQPLNKLATDLWYDSGQMILVGDYLAGNALFFGGIDDEGNDMDIPEDFINVFMRYE
jgi:hypothetical protein